MDKLFLSVLNMSLTGAFVIATVCLARLPLKKAPKVISYALWAVAGFRLVFPFSIESVFSLLPFNAAPIPTDIAMQAVPRIESGIPFVNNAVNNVLPAVTPVASVNPLRVWTAIGAYIWITGVAVMLIYGVVSFVILKRKMRNAVYVESNIYEAYNIKSPFVLGVFAPKIYLPVGLSEHERGYILLHEQTHIRRRDHIVKMFAYFVLCLHWFNPLAWAAFLLCGADMEMSCDERVMKELGGDIRDDYSMSLVRIAAGRRILNGSPLAFGEGGMKERVKNVLNFKKPSRVIIVAAVALVAVLSVGFAVNRTSAPDSILLPNANDVRRIFIEQVNENSPIGETVIDDTKQIQDVFIVMSTAEKTSKHSVNDAPAVGNYLFFRVTLSDERTMLSLYLYSDGETDYIEQPYVGIYKINREASVTLYKIFNSSLDTSLEAREVGTHSSKSNIPGRFIRVGDGSDNKIVTIYSAKDFAAYYQANREAEQLDYGWDGDFAFQYTLNKYDEAFFKNYILVLAGIGEGSGSIRHEFTGVVFDGDIARLQVKRIVPEQGTDDLAYWYLFATFERTDIQNINSFVLEIQDVLLTADKGRPMTLADVRGLAAKGDELTMEDFAGYDGTNVGSGISILQFTVEGGYTLLASAITDKPYVSLGIPGVEESIDIRIDNIDEFISRYPVPDELSANIYQYLEIIMSSPDVSSNSEDYIKAHQSEYDAILDVGITALPTLTGILNIGDRGLRGHIASSAVYDIIERESNKPHSKWADGELQRAGGDVARWSRGFPPTQ